MQVWIGCVLAYRWNEYFSTFKYELVCVLARHRILQRSVDNNMLWLTSLHLIYYLFIVILYDWNIFIIFIYFIRLNKDNFVYHRNYFVFRFLHDTDIFILCLTRTTLCTIVIIYLRRRGISFQSILICIGGSRQP